VRSQIEAPATLVADRIEETSLDDQLQVPCRMTTRSSGLRFVTHWTTLPPHAGPDGA